MPISFIQRLRVIAALLLLMIVPISAFAENAPLRPKVVIVGYFETSKAYGEKGYWGEADRPGELYHWIKGFHLDRRVEVPGAFTAGWTNEDGSILAMKIGPNSLHPAVNITALGLDPDIDLSKAYWLLTGIAGTSPEVGTIGDMVWTDMVVDGDVAHEIDAREIPNDWPTGYFPAGKTEPYPQPRVPAGSAEDVRTWSGRFQANRAHTVFMLNQGLMHWALSLTDGLVPPQTKAMQTVRESYRQPAARAAAKVRSGATLSAQTFWLGARMDQWARDWVAYMSDGRAAFHTTETNDAGTLVALLALGKAGKVDPDRVLLLRGASNFDMPPAGVPAAEQLKHEGPQKFAAYLASLQGLYQTGAVVVQELLQHWGRYQDKPPAAP